MSAADEGTAVLTDHSYSLLSGENRAVFTDHNYSVLSASISPNEKQSLETERLDTIICQFLKEQGVPGATLAVAKHGRIVYEQGYGVAGAGRRMMANTTLRVASISKPITAIAILRLCQDGKLSLDARVFGTKGILKDLKPRGDKRLKMVTVRHLLQHSAGWDRDMAGDAVFWKVAPPAGMAMTSPLYNAHLLQYVLNRKLQFTPGSRHAYSNLGYLVLGEVIEMVTGQTYEDHVKSLLAETGITGMYVGSEKRADRQSAEGEYFNIKEPMFAPSLMPGQEDSPVLPQYGSFLMRNTGAFGGWVSTARDLVLLLCSLETADKIRVPGTTTQLCKTQDSLLDAKSLHAMLQRPSYESGRDWYGLGLDVQDGGYTWGHTGAMEGTCATFQRHHSGLTWAFVLNAWASDMDLDGVVKFALSSVQHLSPFPCNLARACGEELHVMTQDKRQCVTLHVPLHRICVEVEERKMNGFTVEWIGVNTAEQKKGTGLSFNLIFSRNMELGTRTVLVGIEVIKLRAAVGAYSANGFQAELITTYIDSGSLFAIVLLSKRDSGRVQKVDICVHARDYVQSLTKGRKAGFHVVSQSVSHCRQTNQVVVTAIMEKHAGSDDMFSRPLLGTGNCTNNCEETMYKKMDENELLEPDSCENLKTEDSENICFHTKNEDLKTEDRGHMKSEDNKDVTTKNSGHLKTEDSGHLKSEDRGHLKTEDSGHLKTEDSGHLKTEDSGHLKTEDSGHLKTEDSGHLKSEDSGHLKSEEYKTTVTEEDSGQLKTADSGHLTPEDSRHLTPEDNEHMKTENSRHLKTEDNRHLKSEDSEHMKTEEDSGHLRTEDSGHLRTEDGGYLKSEDSGCLKTEDSGQLETKHFNLEDSGFLDIMTENWGDNRAEDVGYFETKNDATETDKFLDCKCENCRHLKTETDKFLDCKCEDCRHVKTENGKDFKTDYTGQLCGESRRLRKEESTSRKRKSYIVRKISLPPFPLHLKLPADSGLSHITTETTEGSDRSAWSDGEHSNSSQTTGIPSPKRVRKTQYPAARLKTLSWVQMEVESFVAEMGRQAKQHCGLQNVHFYPVDAKWYVSGVWSPSCTYNCYHRLGVSRLGLLPALAEAAARDVCLKFVCQYEEEGVTYYALLWKAPQFDASV